jgi:hypothetical protein
VLGSVAEVRNLGVDTAARLRAITKEPLMRDRSVVRLSVTPSTKCSCSGSPPRLARGKTTMERRGGSCSFGAAAEGPDAAPRALGLIA